MKATTIKNGRLRRVSLGILSLILGIPCLSPAQQGMTGDRTSPRPGDLIVKQQVACPDIKPSGDNVVWDFSRIKPGGETYPVLYFTRNGQLSGSEGRHLYTYSLSGDSLKVDVEETSNSIVRYHSPQLLLKYPLTYGSRCGSVVSGKGKYCDRLEIRSEGGVESEIDSRGRLVLPGGDTLQGVLRVHIVKKLNERYAPLPADFDINLPAVFSGERTVDSVHVETDHYQWYGEGYRYPVFEVVERRTRREGQPEETERSAYLFHPLDQLTQLDEDPANEAAQTEDKSLKAARETALPALAAATDVRIFPNPVVSELRITLSLRQPSDVRYGLYDMMGQQVYRSEKAGASGEAVETIDMAAMPQGVYMLRVQAGSAVMNKKIVKQ